MSQTRPVSFLKSLVFHRLKSIRWGWAAVALLLAASMSGRVPHGQTAALPTRGVEEVGRVYLGESLNAYIGHMAMLFVTGKHPTIGNGMMQDTVNWVNDPVHSVIADGYGGLAIYAHPDGADRVLLVDGLVGMELYSQSYPATAYGRDQMWDTVNTTRYSQGKSLLWAFAADDLHSTTGSSFNFAWNTSLVPSVDVFALKTALRTGAFYASAGPVINSVSVSGSTITLALGQTSEVDWLYSGQYDNAGTFSATTAAGANRALKRDTNVITSSLNISAAGVPVSSLKFVRAIIKASSKDARTQPFSISSSGLISNPYPATGTWIKGMSHNHSDAAIDNTTGLSTYRANYAAVGQVAAFETAFSYWEVPYQHLDSDGYPDISSVSPGKVAAGAGAALTITGVNFADGVTAQLGNPQLGNHTLAIVNQSGTTTLQALVPTDVLPGVYDVVVTNMNGTRGNLPLSVTVQEATAGNAGWTSYQVPDLPWNQTMSIAAVGSDIWVGTVKGAAQYKSGAGWSSYIPGNCVNVWSRGIYAIQPDSSGGIWFSSTGMWYRNAAGSWQCQLVGTSEERWGKMAYDSSGKLWVTSRWEEGIAVRSTSSWSRLTSSLPITDLQAITRDAQGYMWVGFNGGEGIQKSLNGSTWTPIAIPSFGPSNHFTNYASVLKAAPPPSGDVWAAVAPMNTDYDPNYAGVVQFINGNPQTYNLFKTPQLPHPRVTDILIAKNGDVWFSTRSGVARLSSTGQWQTFTSQNSGLVCDIVMAMAEDQAGNIWFATANGVSTFNPTSTTTNSPPTLTQPAPQTSTAGTAASLQIQATDPDGDALTYGLTGQPKGLFIGANGLIQGTIAPDAAASNTVTVTVSDGHGGTDSKTFSWTVNPPPPPVAPTGLTAVANSTTQITLTWSDNSSNEQGFRIERSTDNVTFGLVTTTAANATGTATYVNTGLSPSTQYYYRVQAFNTGGSSTYATASATTQSPPPPPSAPTGLGAVADSSTQITLTWTDNSSNEQGFQIYRSIDNSAFTLIATTAANATGTASYVNGGLNASTAYYYRVLAFNTSGSSSYATASATTQAPPPAPPAAPSNLVAQGGSGLVKLTWTDNSTNETGFIIQRTGGSNGPKSITVVGTHSGSSFTYNDTNVARNTSYSYQVLAYNANGNSALSNSSSTKTRPH